MNTIHESALKKVRDALDGVIAELSKPQNELVTSISILEKLRAQLEHMSSQLEDDALPPKGQRLNGMGRLITDSWPLSDPLGNLIIAAEQAYIAE